MTSQDFTIGRLAKAASVNIETVRYYERCGLIPRPLRRVGGFRTYNADHLARIRFIKRSQGLGFTLKEIKELLALRVRSGASCHDVKQRAQIKLDDVKEKIQALNDLQKTLEQFVRACAHKRPTEACPILNSLERPDA